MAQRIYRQLSCRDAGVDCDFLVRAETENEVLSLAGEHACRVHNLCQVTPEMKDKMLSSTASIWCEGGDCRLASRESFYVPPWG